MSKKKILIAFLSFSLLVIFIFTALKTFLTEGPPEQNTRGVKTMRQQSDEDQQRDKEKPYGSHDYGKLIKGRTAWHAFEFKNYTKKDLKILKTRVPCGCADIKYDDRVLKPGEKVLFNVVFDSKLYDGKVKKYFYVFTDSPELPIVKYLMVAEVLPKPEAVCFAVPMVSMNNLKPGETGKGKFPIENRGELDLIVNARIIPGNVLIKTFLPLKIPPGQNKNMHFTITAPEEEGSFRETLILSSNDPKRPIVRVVVKGEAKQ